MDHSLYLTDLSHRQRVLYFCGALPLFEIVAIVCLLAIADGECELRPVVQAVALTAIRCAVVPVNVQVISYWLVIATGINALTLNTGWFAIRKRGTGRHHLVGLHFCLLVARG